LCDDFIFENESFIIGGCMPSLKKTVPNKKTHEVFPVKKKFQIQTATQQQIETFKEKD